MREKERERLHKYLGSWQKGRTPEVKLPTYRGEVLKIKGGDYEVHLDDKIFPDPEEKETAKNGDIQVEIEHAALTFVVPGKAGKNGGECSGR